MNLPVGTPKETGLKLSQEGLSQTALALSREGFTGYLVLTIEGVDGVEEAVLFFKGYEIIGALYEFTRYGNILAADTARRSIIARKGPRICSRYPGRSSTAF